MADKKPLKIESGTVEQFATGDTVPVLNGGTGTTTSTGTENVVLSDSPTFTGAVAFEDNPITVTIKAPLDSGLEASQVFTSSTTGVDTVTSDYSSNITNPTSTFHYHQLMSSAYSSGADSAMFLGYGANNLNTFAEVFCGASNTSRYGAINLFAQDQTTGERTEFIFQIENDPTNDVHNVQGYFVNSHGNVEMNYSTNLTTIFNFNPYSGGGNGELEINGLDETGADAATFTSGNAPAVISPQKWIKVKIGGADGWLPWFSTGTPTGECCDGGGGGSVPSGVMFDFAGTSAPTGYLLCDGSAVDRTTYAALFTAIGTTWGVGDGSTTFNVPDFRRRVAVGSGGTGTAELGNAVGNVGGDETHTLVISEMPTHTHIQNSHNHIQNSHNHTQNAHAHAVTVTTISTSAVGGYPTRGNTSGAAAGHAATVNSNTATNIETTATNIAATATNQNTGGNGAHNNIQPSAVVLKIIKT